MSDCPVVPTAGAAAWINARGVRFSHGGRRVLHGVDLALFPGRHYVILGPNGAGKSTFLDVLARLRRPEAGDVSVMGRSLSAYRPEALARVLSLAPQEYALGFSFTVREVAGMGRRPYLGRWGRMSAEDHAAVDRALARVRLGEVADRSVTALSGGERKRCVVARCLAQETPVVLLDEPCSGLDVAQALLVMAAARELAEGGRVVVTVSHDLNLAAAFGHTLVFLKDGRIAAQGDVGEVFTGEVLSEVYGAAARVRWDEFSGAPVASFALGSRTWGTGGVGHL